MMPERWRWFLPLGWLLLGLLVLDLAMRLTAPTWERYSPDDWLERVRTCAHEPRDIVFLGGSPVSEGIDPSLLMGLNWQGEELHNGYSLGLPGGTTTDVYFAYRQGCPTPPKLVIYGVAPSDWNDSRNEPHGPGTLYSWADLQEACAVRPELTSWYRKHYGRTHLANLSAIWKHRHGLRMASAAAFLERFPESVSEAAAEAQRLRRSTERIRHGNGYAPAEYFATRRYSDMKASGWVAPPFQALAKYQTGSHLRFLKKLAEELASSGAQLVLLEMPLTADLETRHAAECRQFQRDLRAFLKDYPDVRHLAAARQAVNLSDDHFSDLIHLNSGGADKLSRWLKQQLEALR